MDDEDAKSIVLERVAQEPGKPEPEIIGKNFFFEILKFLLWKKSNLQVSQVFPKAQAALLLRTATTSASGRVTLPSLNKTN
jgi:hypothetical protein